MREPEFQSVVGRPEPRYLAASAHPARSPSERERVPTKQEYERVVIKAEVRGLGSLNDTELHLLKKLVNEISDLGSRARKLVG